MKRTKTKRNRLTRLKTIPVNAGVCLYGSGEAGRCFRNYLQEKRPDVDIVFYVDSFKSGEMDGLPIVTVAQLLDKQDPPDLILITSSAHREIEKKLDQLQIENYIVVDEKLIKGEESLALMNGLILLYVVSVTGYCLLAASGNLSLLVSCFALFLFCFAWRLLPLLKQTHRGSDAYYFLLTREEYLKTRKLPVTLPGYFSLENSRQDYPPGFTVFLSLLPRQVIEKLYWTISPFVDSVVCILLYLYCYDLTGNLTASSIAILVYIFSTSAIRETQTLTSRQLGVLFFFMASVSGLRYILVGHWWFLAVFLVSGILMLMTHKLSTQAFIMMFVLTAAIRGELQFLLLLAMLIMSAVVASGGYYIKILRGHWDFVRFWTKNWNNLGAHQVESSPVYNTGDSQPRGHGHVYSKGMASKLRFLRRYITENLFVAAAVWILIEQASRTALTGEMNLILLCCLCTWGIGLASYMVPFLRGIGFGLQYGKYALLFGVPLCAGLMEHPVISYGVYAVLVYSVYGAVRYLLGNLTGKPSGWNLKELDGLFDYVRKLDDPLIMSLPNNYNDLLAYKCKKRVLWGGHHTPSGSWGVVIPVLRMSAGDIIKKYGVTHLLLDHRYTSAERLKVAAEPVWKGNDVSLYVTDNVRKTFKRTKEGNQ
ncbi:MAG: hypothetical protein GY940_27370 [bacterium]|nr:hypothetical protein [bacterium]